MFTFFIPHAPAGETLAQTCARALVQNERGSFDALAAEIAAATARDGVRSFEFENPNLTIGPRGGEITDQRPDPALLRFRAYFEARGYALSLLFRPNPRAAGAADPRFDFGLNHWPSCPVTRTAVRGTIYVRLDAP